MSKQWNAETESWDVWSNGYCGSIGCEHGGNWFVIEEDGGLDDRAVTVEDAFQIFEEWADAQPYGNAHSLDIER